jgi:hypothetical protein
VFESLEKRRTGPSLWKAFGITCSLASLFVILYVHFHDQHEADEAERRHDAYKAASEKRDSAHRFQMAGIAVEVPVEPSSKGNYQDGGFVADNFEVTWNLGAPWSTAEADRHAQDFAAKHLGFTFGPTHDFMLAGAPARAYELEHADHHIYLAYGSCAGRRVHLLVYETRALFERMTHTFECVPDKTIDLARRNVVVDAIAGWKRVEPDAVPLALDNGKGVRVTTWLLEREYDKSIADVVIPAAAEAGLHLRDHPGTRNDKVFYTGYYDDNSPAYLFAFRCPDDDIGVVIVRGPSDKLGDGVTLADTARCLQYEDAMPVY